MPSQKILPENIDRYQITSECGNGGMSNVYQAFDPQRQREVAVKVLLYEFRSRPDYKVQFKREIDINSAFRHEAVVPIYGYGMFKGQLYLVMRYLPGGSLNDRAGAGKTLPLAEVVDLLLRITPALDAAHQQGIIHRNLKPHNILYDDQGQAYLSDFGISLLLEEQMAQAGSSGAGLPPYMSPEQARGGTRLDGRSDLYSLGVMVYEMLSGRLPYYVSDPVKIANSQGAQAIPDILKANPRLPSGCRDFMQKALSRNPAGRFASGAEMTDALQAVANEASGSGRVSKRTEVLFAPSSSRVTLMGDSDSTPSQPPPRPAPQQVRAPKPAPEPSNPPPQVRAPRPEVRPAVRPPVARDERDQTYRQEPRPAVRPEVRPSPRAAEPPVQPYREQTRPEPIQQARPQRIPSSPDLSKVGGDTSNILYRLFGVNFRAPTIPVPVFLRPITSSLGISNEISLWPQSVPGPIKILLLLFAVLALIVLCGAACFLVVRFGLNRGATFSGWDWALASCLQTGGS